jgi:hypothetical protein
MNAFDPIAFAHRLEDAGFDRAQSETLASEMRSAMLELVTHEQLKAALDAQTLRIGGILAAMLAVLFAALKLIP